MSKKSKNPLIILVVIIVLILVGVFVYVEQKNEPTTTQPSGNCETVAGKEVCTESYLGLSEDAARQKAQEDSLTPKIRSIDGDTSVVNDALGGKPIYFTIVNDKITIAEFY